MTTAQKLIKGFEEANRKKIKAIVKRYGYGIIEGQDKHGQMTIFTHETFDVDDFANMARELVRIDNGINI